MAQLTINKNGKLLAKAMFTLWQLPASCSCKVMGHLCLYWYGEGESKENKLNVYKLIANTALTGEFAIVEKGNDYFGWGALRTRIVMTAHSNNTIFDFIKALDLQIGPEYPGGHGIYKMITGALDSDKHIYTDIPEEYTIGEIK